jgi:hypothetical protein
MPSSSPKEEKMNAVATINKSLPAVVGDATQEEQQRQ